MADDSGKDSFNTVKEFLARIGGRTPERGEIEEISEALRDIYARLLRVRAVAPSVDLSERMWALMAQAGLRPVPVRMTPLIRRLAAGLL